MQTQIWRHLRLKTTSRIKSFLGRKGCLKYYNYLCFGLWILRIFLFLVTRIHHQVQSVTSLKVQCFVNMWWNKGSYSSKISVHVNALQTSSRKIRQRESVYLTHFKNALASELISMYELVYCSWFIVIATAATNGLTMSTRFGEDWNRVSILNSNRCLTSQHEIERSKNKHTNLLGD